MIYRGYKFNGFLVLFVIRRGYFIRFYIFIFELYLIKKGILIFKCVINFYFYFVIFLLVVILSIFFFNLRILLICMFM